MELKDIEFWEHEYLEQIYYLLSIDEKKMRDGLNTKEDIRQDWEKFLGDNTSDFATGSERIFYWLFNQFGLPNSSPIGSDMFFETYNAYVHIDIKTVKTSNIGDYKKNIFVGDNQNSYKGHITGTNYELNYVGNLPTFYTKRNNEGKITNKKVCLTYFICILYNPETLYIETILITSMPNGELSDIYGDKAISPGKNPGKIRFNYTIAKNFELLQDKPLRTKILIYDPETQFKNKLEKLSEIFKEQSDLTDNI